MLRFLGAFWIWMSWNMHVPTLGQDLMTSWEIQTIAGDGQMEVAKRAYSQGHTEYSLPKMVASISGTAKTIASGD